MGKEIVTGFPTHAGGVLTVEGGVLRGELILATREVAGGATPGNFVEALVERVGARDQYTVAGSPVSLEGRAHEQVHWAIIERLQTPVRGGWLNEPPAELR